MAMPMNPIAMGQAALAPLGAVLGAREQRQNLNQAEDKLRAVKSWKEMGPKSDRELAFEDASRSNYLAQQALQDRMEGDLGRRYGLQGQAQGVYGDLMSGAAYDYSPQELQRARQFTGAQLQSDEDAINRMLDERLGQVRVDAANRGIRGGAGVQMETGAVADAAGLYQQQRNQANIREQQMLNDILGQRLQYQSGAAGNMANYGQALQQQAFMNRQALQNPVLMNKLASERAFEASSYAPSGGYANAVMARANTPGTANAYLMGMNQGLGQMGGAFGGGGMGGMPGGVAGGGMA